MICKQNGYLKKRQLTSAPCNDKWTLCKAYDNCIVILFNDKQSGIKIYI